MIVDAILSFPSIVLALAIVASLGPSILNLALALAFVRIPIYSRIARGQTLLGIPWNTLPVEVVDELLLETE